MGNEVIVVTGLPRAGTSMIMQMLAAGGVPILSDDARAADEDNPRGYFEYDPVKRTYRDASWIAEATGKAVKVVAPLVLAIPAHTRCLVISIERDLDEVFMSQERMLRNRGVDVPERRAEVKQEYSRIQERVRDFLAKRPNTRLLWLQHRDVLAHPDIAAAAINRFLGGWMNEDAMARVVRPELHRQRGGEFG
jgi:hypothetical protein